MSLEKILEEEIDSLISIARKYFFTSTHLFGNTRNYFLQIYREKTSDFLSPGIFLLLNVSVTELLSIVLGYSLDDSKFLKNPIGNYVTDIALTSFSFMSGYLILCWLLTARIQKNQKKVIAYKDIFLILASGSYLFPIIFFIFHFGMVAVGDAGNSFIYSILDTAMSDISNGFSNVGVIKSISKLFGLIISFSLFFYILEFVVLLRWLWTLLIGLEVFGVIQPVRNLLTSLFLYFLISSASFWLVGIYINSKVINTMIRGWIVQPSAEIEKESPNLIRLQSFFEAVSKEKKIGSSLRYKSCLLAAACCLELNNKNKETGLAKKIHKLLSDGKTTEAYDFLTTECEIYKSNEFDRDYIFYGYVKSYLDMAKKVKSEEVTDRERELSEFTPRQSFDVPIPIFQHPPRIIRLIPP